MALAFQLIGIAFNITPTGRCFVVVFRLRSVTSTVHPSSKCLTSSSCRRQQSQSPQRGAVQFVKTVVDVVEEVHDARRGRSSRHLTVSLTIALLGCLSARACVRQSGLDRVESSCSTSARRHCSKAQFSPPALPAHRSLPVCPRHPTASSSSAAASTPLLMKRCRLLLLLLMLAYD